MIDNATSGTSHRVMIVDDDEITSGLLSHSLGADFMIRSVSSGSACLDEIGTFMPEVVLLAYESGGDDFISKPPMPKEVLGKVRPWSPWYRHKRGLDFDVQLGSLLDDIKDS